MQQVTEQNPAGGNRLGFKNHKKQKFYYATKFLTCPGKTVNPHQYYCTLESALQSGGAP
jgi:hypothetical protein